MSKNEVVEKDVVVKQTKKSAVKKKATKKSTPNTASKKEIETLIKENEEWKSRVSRLESLMLGMKPEKEDKGLNSDDYIKVISLCPFRLNLSTAFGGKGRRYSFDKFGEEKMIPYGKLVEIMEVNSTFLDGGFFYIMDSRVISRHGLDDIYENLLTQEEIIKILDCGNDSVSFYSSANERQREMIINSLISKVRDDEKSMDLNVISEISRLSDVDIIRKANEAKLYMEEES